MTGLKMTNRVELIASYLDELYADPPCELHYDSPEALLIAVMLSAQTTDKRVNQVTEVLYRKYPSLESLKEAPVSEIECILRPLGSHHKKAVYVQEIARLLVDEYQGQMPKQREVLETFPGVGRKTVSVVLSELYGAHEFAVDTHVERVSKRLALVYSKDNVLTVERKLKQKFKKSEWGMRHKQLVLFGRYHCKAVAPLCENCKLREICKYEKKK